MLSLFKASLAIIYKDIVLELRTREILSSMFVFALLVVVVFSFIFEPGEHELQRIAGGTYWMALIFAGLLGLGKSMQQEITGGNLAATLLAPIPRNAIFFGKAISNLLMMLMMQAIMIPLFAVLYDVNFLSNGVMIFVIFAATYGFALPGTLFSLIASGTRTREIMLPLLLLPAVIPVMLAAIQLTNAILMGVSPESYAKWLRLIVVYDIIFTTLAALLFSSVVEE